MLLCRKQEDLDPTVRDYSYIEYLQKSVVACNFNLTAPDSTFRQKEFRQKEVFLNLIRYHESKRDFFAPSLRQVNHLIQIDEKPNLELLEPKWELYKISISFQGIRKFNNIFD